MTYNPLVHAVHVFDHHMETLYEVIFEAFGEAGENDDRAHDLAMDLVTDASIACARLSPRAKVARLNVLWREFREEHGLHKREVER